MNILQRGLITLVGLGLLSSASLAPETQSAVVLSKYALTGLTSAESERVARAFEVLKSKDHTLEAVVAKNRLQEFLTLAPQARLLVEDIALQSRHAFRQSRTSMFELTGYHSFDDVQQILKSTSETYADRTVLINYGISAEGHPLTALRVGAHVKEPNSNKPRVLLTAATHGDEIITTEVMLSLINTLLSQARAQDPRMMQILEDHEIVFIPVVNPDGFSHQDRYDGEFDPNRSYPYPGHEDVKASPSVAAELQFIQNYPIAGSIDFHAYSGVVIYPWGYTHQSLDPASLKTFTDISAKMIATNHYQAGPIADIMYIAPGSSVDFYYWKNKSISLGIEMGDDKSPAPSEFPRYIQEQLESTWLFIESFKSGAQL